MTERYWIDRAHVRGLSNKISAIDQWLNEHAPDCEKSQRHLDEGTVERAYWHYGYLCAARDFMKLIRPHSAQ